MLSALADWFVLYDLKGHCDSRWRAIDETSNPLIYRVKSGRRVEGGEAVKPVSVPSALGNYDGIYEEDKVNILISLGCSKCTSWYQRILQLINSLRNNKNKVL